MRSWARGYRCGVFQFVKSGKWKVGEAKAARELGGIDWEKMGDGWTWISRDLEESADKAREGWAEVKRRIAAERYEFLLLDELTYPIKYGWIDEDEVVATLRDRPGFQHVVVTGRDASPGLIEAADLVSEVVKVKHPMDAGHPRPAGDRVVAVLVIPDGAAQPLRAGVPTALRGGAHAGARRAGRRRRRSRRVAVDARGRARRQRGGRARAARPRAGAGARPRVDRRRRLRRARCREGLVAVARRRPARGRRAGERRHGAHDRRRAGRPPGRTATACVLFAPRGDRRPRAARLGAARRASLRAPRARTGVRVWADGAACPARSTTPRSWSPRAAPPRAARACSARALVVPPGATGDVDTDLARQGRAPRSTRSSAARGAVVVHVGAPDEAAHRRDRRRQGRRARGARRRAAGAAERRRRPPAGRSPSAPTTAPTRSTGRTTRAGARAALGRGIAPAGPDRMTEAHSAEAPVRRRRGRCTARRAVEAAA